VVGKTAATPETYPKLLNMTKEQAKNKFMVQALANIPTEFNEDGTLKRKHQYIEIAKKMAKENIESYRISPELVFINRKPKYRNIRKEWISVLLSKGYLLADIKEITNWTKKQIEEDYFSEIIHY
jgi:hypothetical protein